MNKFHINIIFVVVFAFFSCKNNLDNNQIIRLLNSEFTTNNDTRAFVLINLKYLNCNTCKATVLNLFNTLNKSKYKDDVKIIAYTDPDAKFRKRKFGKWLQILGYNSFNIKYDIKKLYNLCADKPCIILIKNNKLEFKSTIAKLFHKLKTEAKL